jgi:2-keto-3-deoxy-L-rhamnonate aldolase RhmA
VPPTPNPGSFRQRFLAAEPLLGTFIKTPTSHAIEILGDIGYDFVVIDAEHAPFDRRAIDIALLAARAAGTAGIVRVADSSPAKLLAALDDGAAGVLVPHVSTVEKARAVASACRYRDGTRGFSNSPRAGGYGRLGIRDHVRQADETVTVIAMIEDPEALDAIDAIVAVDGIDGIFIGRGDLTVALGAGGLADPVVRAAAERIVQAARERGKSACLMVAGVEEAREWRSLGASAFIVSSDQGFLRQAAAKVNDDFASWRAETGGKNGP